MTNHITQYNPANGYAPLVAPGIGELEHLTFGMINLAPAQTLSFSPEQGHEAALTILTGSINAADGNGQRWEGVGGRTSVFEGSTDTFFVPPACRLELHALNTCEIAVSQARSDIDGPVTLFPATDALLEQRGYPGWRREVRTYLRSSANVGRLILGEVASALGEWSSFPPHKHDIDNMPAEADLEELYFFKLDPPTGFAFQGLYSPDDPASRNRAYVVRHHDIVTIPRGYHPVAVAPGHRIYYYWALAGAGHILKVHVEDSMRWLEPEFKIKD